MTPPSDGTMSSMWLPYADEVHTPYSSYSLNPEPADMVMLREALPKMLRDGLVVPPQAVAVEATLWLVGDHWVAPPPSFVAHLLAGRTMAVPVHRDILRDAQEWAEGLVLIAADVDPRAAEARSQPTRVTAYAPFPSGETRVELWFGDSAEPWRFPAY